MKTFNKIFNGVVVAAAMIMSLSSCEKVDYPDRFRATDGVPTIYGIRYAATDTFIEKAFMEEVLCVLGDNLTSVNQIYFNDQKAILNTSYITNSTLLVAVPKTMPVEETNAIYFVTAKQDTVKYDFKILAPAARVLEMSFEYAEPGDVVSIYGNYFYEKEGADNQIKVEFAGNVEVPHSDIEIVSLTEMKIKIPAGALPGRVKVTTPSGIGQSNFMYKDNRGLLFDFDGTNGLYTVNKGWHPADIVAGGVSGDCLQLGDGTQQFTADGGDWQDGKAHFEYWAGNWQDPETYGTWDGRRLNDIVDFTNFSTMALKFEVKVEAANAWTGCPMQIIFSSVTMVSNGNADVKDIYGNTLAGCNNTYFNDAKIGLPRYFWRPWEATGSFHTDGKWITVTVPISAFTQFWDGTAATGKLDKETFANLEFFFAGGKSVEGTPCKPIICFDNIRAVPAK